MKSLQGKIGYVRNGISFRNSTSAIAFTATACNGKAME